MISSIAIPENHTRLGGDALSHQPRLAAPRDSTLPDHTATRYPITHDVPVKGDTSLSKKGYGHWAASSSSMQNEAQAGMRQQSKRPSLRRVGRRLPARTFPPPARPRKVKIPPPFAAQVPAEYDVTSPRAPLSKPSTLRNTGPPLANQIRNEDARRKDGEVARPTVRVRTMRLEGTT